MKTLEGFSAYEEIRNLAERRYPNDDVHVIASIFGNEYEVKIGNKVITGTSQVVRQVLGGL